MPSKLDRDATVNIPCPKCGNKTEQAIATLELSPRLRCPTCLVLFRVDFKKIMQRIKEAEAKIQDQKRRTGG
jgi:late competence protein required for DNA uptake (superfamily II DNA/RNA helicase)